MVKSKRDQSATNEHVQKLNTEENFSVSCVHMSLCKTEPFTPADACCIINFVIYGRVILGDLV